MADSKPPISPSEFCLRSASERIAAEIDPAPAQSGEPGAVGQESRSDRSTVAIYYRNKEEVREGFLVALRAMGLADVEQLPLEITIIKEN